MGQVLPGGETQKSLMYLSLEQGRENVGRSLGRREESKQFFQAGFMPFDQGIDTRVWIPLSVVSQSVSGSASGSRGCTETLEEISGST